MRPLRAVLIAAVVGLLALVLIQPDRIHSDLGSLLPDATQAHHFEPPDQPMPLLIAVEGFDNQALQSAQTIKKALEDLTWVEGVTFGLLQAPDQINHNRIQGRFTPVALEPEAITRKLEALYDSIASGTLYQGIDQEDPLGLFAPPKSPPAPPQRNGYLILPDYGYLLMASATLQIKSPEAAQRAESQLQGVLSKSTVQTRHFSPFLFTAQNSRFIEKEAKALVAAAVAILLFLYLLLIREPLMLLAAIVTLAASCAVATLTLQIVLGEIALMALVFGAAISSVAVDYLFHHYTHGHYHHTRPLNREVFFGFLSTIAGFVIFSFVPFDLIKQMSLFAIVALSFSYLFFAFGLSGFLAHKPHKPPLQTQPPTTTIDRSMLYGLLLTGGVLLAVGLSKLTLEESLSALDYNNQPLQNTEAGFKEALPTLQNHPTLIKAPSKEALLGQIETIRATHGPLPALTGNTISNQRAQEITRELEAYDFDRLRQLLTTLGPKLGFSPLAFHGAYRFVPAALQELQKGQSAPQRESGLRQSPYGLWGTLVFAPDRATAEAIGTPFSYAKNLSKSLIHAQQEMLFWGGLSLLVVLFLVLYKTRKSAPAALVFILLPVSVALLVATLGGPVNIMHLFALFILLVLGIDYGIYIAADHARATRRAIAYSLLSSAAGFGVLLFSQVGALHAIGVVITSGLFTMALLLLLVLHQTNSRRSVSV